MTSKFPYDLIIFDCDGTLVDSEYLNNKISSDLLIEFGLTDYTPQRCIQEFAGVSWTTIKQILEERHSIEIPRTLVDNYITRVNEAMTTLLNPIHGMLEFVADCKAQTKIAVGSNGMKDNVWRSLELTGFLEHFAPQEIITKIDVPQPKPAPDMFLMAANLAKVDPHACLVLEDSVTGTLAGKAAGMEVWGVMMASHGDENDKINQKEKLIDAGASHVFDDIIHMRKHLGL